MIRGGKKKITALVRLKKYLTLYNIEFWITCGFYLSLDLADQQILQRCSFVFKENLFFEKEKIKEGVVLRDTDTPVEKQYSVTERFFLFQTY